MKKVIILLMAVLLAVPFLNAQNNKYGTDSSACVINLSLYREFVKQKNYPDAVDGWRNAYRICPQSTKQLYKDGEKIFKYFLKEANKAKNEDAVSKYLDTLTQVFDQRIELYGDTAFVKGKRGYYTYKYRKSAFESAYNDLIYSANKNKISVAYLQYLMFTTAKMFKKEKIDAGTVVQNFSVCVDILKKSIEKADTDKKKEKLKKLSDNISNIFVKSGAANCDVLVDYYTPKFEADKENAELLKTITKFLDMNKCTDSKLFFDASEALYPIEPSGPAAYNIAILSVKKDNLPKAAEYYQKAADLTEDVDLKSKYYLDLAKVQSKQGKFGAGRMNALKAAQAKPGWGDPYIFIGRIYASAASSCGETKFQKSAVYWVVVDKFIKAKAVDSTVAEKANKLIGQYKKYFPSKEDAFFETINAGDTYKVGCWINESTKARF